MDVAKIKVLLINARENYATLTESNRRLGALDVAERFAAKVSEHDEAIAALQAQGAEVKHVAKYFGGQFFKREGAEIPEMAELYLAPPAQAARVPDEWADVMEQAARYMSFAAGDLRWGRRSSDCIDLPDDMKALSRKIKNLLAAPAPAEKVECFHDETHRAGVAWTVCDSCEMKWHDGKQETIYRCKSCEAVYLDKVSQCDCMPDLQEFDEWIMHPATPQEQEEAE